MGIENFCIDEETQTVVFSDPELTDEQKATLESRFTNEKDALHLRVLRNNKLATTDWTQGTDVPNDIKSAWATYRQQLRDLPANTSDPANPTYPTKPE